MDEPGDGASDEGADTAVNPIWIYDESSDDSDMPQQFVITLRDGSACVGDIDTITDLMYEAEYDFDPERRVKGVWRICHGAPVRARMTTYRAAGVTQVWLWSPDTVLWEHGSYRI